MADVRLEFTVAQPDGGGWPGDTPLVDFDTAAARDLGWWPRFSAETAIRTAASGIAARYRERGLPLLTAIERRAATSDGIPASR